jgi:hypothetical protein
MTTYEVRAHHQPTAMPLGTSIISTHSSAAAAWRAIAVEREAFRRSPYGTSGYLPRIVVAVAGDGSQRLVRMDPADAGDIDPAPPLEDRCAVCGGRWHPGTTDHTRCASSGYDGL